MAYLLVPLGVSATEATVWIGAINDSLTAVQLVSQPRITQTPRPVEQGHWASQTGKYTVDYQRVTLGGLEPRTTYALELLVNGVSETSFLEREFLRAELTTLPDRLPTAFEKPFTVLLGSCFCTGQDQAGTVGRTFFQLPAGDRPDVKILCGDQVYLDAPWIQYLLHTHTPAELEHRFFETYLDAWMQTGVASGFRKLLMVGANYFCSDDHEFWNNAPNRASYVLDTWPLFDEREAWFTSARTLYQIFQTPSTVTTFSVGTLSFCIADTRINRRANRTRFMENVDLQVVDTWIRNLQGPGVLVIGQPVLSEQTTFLQGYFADWTLVDFDQYVALTQRLAQAKHSIVVLTGDVHFGRIARCTMASGIDLMEVISSPLALVDKEAEGHWIEAPPFPAFEIPGMVKAQTRTEQAFRFNEGHFLTLEFSAAGAFVNITVKLWPIVHDGGLPHPTVVYPTDEGKFLQ
jgi:hypothetical protein